ncbi:MAG: hypothetical protein HY400_01190 [Elusimicrobia bacterium]|nr:hypothetical protein [Elusimicrobiota bacterium]
MKSGFVANVVAPDKSKQACQILAEGYRMDNEKEACLKLLPWVQRSQFGPSPQQFKNYCEAAGNCQRLNKAPEQKRFCENKLAIVTAIRRKDPAGCGNDVRCLVLLKGTVEPCVPILSGVVDQFCRLNAQYKRRDLTENQRRIKGKKNVPGKEIW